MMSYSEWIPDYPDVDDPKIATLLAIKKEFQEVRGSTTETAPIRGKLYKHQNAFIRLLMNYDRCLNISETGTGKSCSIIGLCEYYKKHPGQIKKVYVLEKGPTTADDFRYQIFNNCTDGEYETAKIKQTKNYIQKKKLIKDSIAEWYNILTYKKCSKLGITDEDIHLKFDDSIIFVDEAHNLRNDKKEKEKKDGDEVEEDNEEKYDIETVYAILHKICHTAHRCKIILATATPMINSVVEIVRLMNLINPLDMQLPLDWNYEYITLNQLEPYFRGKISYVRVLDTGAEKFDMGEPLDKIYSIDTPDKTTVSSKIIGKQPAIKLITKDYPSTIKIVKCQMSRHQYNGYIKVYNENGKKAFSDKILQASNFIYPDGSYGTTGFRKYINEEKGKYSLSDTLREHLSDIENLKKCGTKIYKIVTNEYYIAFLRGKLYAMKKDKIEHIQLALRDIINFIDILGYSCKGKQEIVETKQTFTSFDKLYEEFQQQDDPDYETQVRLTLDIDKALEQIGNSFCYCRYYVNSGAVLIGLILELYGFKKYTQTDSAFNIDKTLKRDIFPSNRYAILTSGQDSLNASLLELFNSPENRHGEYIQMIIGTPTSRDGINLSNCLRGYLLMPDWHPSGMHQALSRIMRSTSHEALLNDIRNRLLREGRPIEEAHLDVEIYRLAATFDDIDSDETPVDISIYEMAEEKNLRIKRMIRFMKICAMDCLIHYDRNVRVTDKEGSEDCDYGKCEYLCYNTKKIGGIAENITTTEEDNYDIIFSEDIIASCENDIISLMKTNFIIKIEKLYEMLSYKKRFILLAANNIIRRKTILQDRFGFKSYLYNYGDYIFINRDFLTSIDSVIVPYQTDITVLIEENFVDMSREIQKSNITEILYKMDKIGNKIIELSKIADPSHIELAELNDCQILFNNYIFKDLPLENRVELFEKSFVKRTSMEDPLSDLTINKFIFFLKKTRRQKKYLATLKSKLSVTKPTGPGRPSTKKKVEDSNEIFWSDLEDCKSGTDVPVFIHAIFDSDFETNKHGVNAKLRDSKHIRIFVEDEGVWREPDQFEHIVYKNIYDRQIKEYFAEYESNKIYGILHQDGTFQIVDKEGQKTIDGTDTRNINTGKNSTSYTIPNLLSFLDILYTDFGYKSPGVGSVATLNEQLREISKTMNKNYSDEDTDRIQNLYNWIKLKYKKKELSDLIQTGMSINNLILRI